MIFQKSWSAQRLGLDPKSCAGARRPGFCCYRRLGTANDRCSRRASGRRCLGWRRSAARTRRAQRRASARRGGQCDRVHEGCGARLGAAGDGVAPSGASARCGAGSGPLRRRRGTPRWWCPAADGPPTRCVRQRQRSLNGRVRCRPPFMSRTTCPRGPRAATSLLWAEMDGVVPEAAARYSTFRGSVHHELKYTLSFFVATLHSTFRRAAACAARLGTARATRRGSPRRAHSRRGAPAARPPRGQWPSRRRGAPSPWPCA